MTVYKDKARDVWIYDFWLNGQRHKATCRNEIGMPVATRRLALAIQEKIRVELRSTSTDTTLIKSSDYTLAEAIAARAAEAQRLKNFRDVKLMLSEIWAAAGFVDTSLS